MQAIRFHQFGGPEVLQLDEIPAPTLGPGEVLIAVKASGVNPVDTYIRAGIYGDRPLPFTPGLDPAGVVEAVGTGVAGVSLGQRVYAAGVKTGAYAEKCLADASLVFPLPDAISFTQAAGINVPYATAYRALVGRAQCKAGERVLVHGASGGVGIATCQLARAMGLHVTGTASTPEGRALIQREGAHTALDHTQEGYLEGQSFDVIIEMLANVNLARDLTVLNRYGRVVIIGNRGTVEINPRETMSRDAAILGMTLFNVPPTELQSIHAALYAGLENGTLRPVIGQEFALPSAAAAQIAVMAPGKLGKIVLVV
ncbi:NADPH:quinone reductase [Armatimonas sp.]|uniref:NADPH:quinone reductase n=1 Tax=Armatimonas sp. TaxID=1872638 RepID=UPI003753A618